MQRAIVTIIYYSRFKLCNVHSWTIKIAQYRSIWKFNFFQLIYFCKYFPPFSSLKKGLIFIYKSTDLKGLFPIHIFCADLKGMFPIHIFCADLKGMFPIHIFCADLKGMFPIHIFCADLKGVFPIYIFWVDLKWIITIHIF